MKPIIEKTILQWKEELKLHKEKLNQANIIIENEKTVIQMIEGGIQFGEHLLKQNVEEDQKSNKEEPSSLSKTKQ